MTYIYPDITTWNRRAPQADEAIAALRELVALKDLKDKAENLPHEIRGDCPKCFARFKYQERKPLAWAAARAALEKEKQP